MPAVLGWVALSNCPRSGIELRNKMAIFVFCHVQDPFEQQGIQSEDGAYDELNAPEYSTDEFRMFHFKASMAKGMVNAAVCTWNESSRRPAIESGDQALSRANFVLSCDIPALPTGTHMHARITELTRMMID